MFFCPFRSARLTIALGQAFFKPLCLAALEAPSQSDPKACPGHSNVEPNASRSGRKLMVLVLPYSANRGGLSVPLNLFALA